MAVDIENRVWDPAECLSPAERGVLQAERLRETVRRATAVPFYRDAFRDAGVSTDDIRTPDDVRRLPFTTKADLRENYPWGFLAVPREKIARVHGSSGTTGKPTFVAYTAADRDLWAGLCARFLVSGGLRPEHLAQVSFGYGLFTGGFGLHYGIEKVGAGVIPAASGNTERQLLLLRDLAPDVLISTPSYALSLAEAIHEAGLAGKLALRYAHFGGEPWTDRMREQIESSLGILAFDNYGLSEVIGPGVSGECRERAGMHVQEDHFIVECLDPETLEPVPDGEAGELVFTSLTKEAMPIIRYRTRDIAWLNRGRVCPCGRTGALMGRVTGRTDDMLVIRGVNVYPSQIEEALLRVEGTAPHYHVVLERTGAMDDVTVRVEMAPGFVSDSLAVMERFRENVARSIAGITGLRMRIELAPPQTLERFQGKARRVEDRRNLKD